MWIKRHFTPLRSVMLKVCLHHSFLHLLKVISSWVACCDIANLGQQPRGQAWSFCSSQQPTTIVCVFVYREICCSNSMCGGKKCGPFDSLCEEFHLKENQYPNINKTLPISCMKCACVVACVNAPFMLLHMWCNAATLSCIHKKKKLSTKEWSARIQMFLCWSYIQGFPFSAAGYLKMNCCTCCAMWLQNVDHLS